MAGQRIRIRLKAYDYRVLDTSTGEIVDTCCDAWNWLLGQTGRIRSLCSYPWLEQVSN